MSLVSSRLFLFLSLLALAFASSEVGECCVNRGAVSGHFIGLIILLINGIALNQGVARFIFPRAYYPGSSAFCRRLVAMEAMEVGYIVLSWKIRPGNSDGEEIAYVVFTILKAATVVYLLVAWSGVVRRMGLFAGSTKDTRRMESLSKQLRACRTAITGRRLVPDSLRKEIKSFNRRLVIKYAMTRRMAGQQLLLKGASLAFVGFQYFKFCRHTNCSFYRQLSTCLVLLSTCIFLIDFLTLTQNKAFTIKIDDGSPKGDQKKTAVVSASVSQLEAYTLIRDLIAEIMECGRFAVFELTGVAEFRNLSVVTYEWQQNPEVDPRIDACMWMVSYAITLANEINLSNAVSVTGLHLASATMRRIREQVASNTPSRVEIMHNLAALYQSAFFALPDESRMTLSEIIKTWATNSKTSADPQFQALNALVNMLPESNQGVRTVEENVDILKTFFDIQFKELVTGEDLHIHDDAYLEWIYVAWADLKIRFSKDSLLQTLGEIEEVQPLLHIVYVVQEPALLTATAQLLQKLRVDLTDTFVQAGDALHTFIEELKKLTAGKEIKTHTAESKENVSRTAAASKTLPATDVLKKSFKDMSTEGHMSRKQFAEFLRHHEINLPPLQKNKLLADDVVEWDEFEKEIPFLLQSGLRKSAVASAPNAKSATLAPTKAVAKSGSSLREIEFGMGFGPDGNMSRQEFIHFLNDNYIEVLVPCTTVQKIPAEMIRCKDGNDVKSGEDLIAPLKSAKLVKFLDDDLDVRQFCHGSESIVAILTSPLVKSEAAIVERKKPKGGKTTTAPSPNNAPAKRASTIKPPPKGLAAWLPTARGVMNIFLDYTLWFLLASAFIVIFVRAMATAGGDGSSTNDITFFGLPPHYDFNREVTQQYLVPLIYGIMHCNLAFLFLLPLTMSRWTIRFFSKHVHLGRFLHIEHMYHLHMRLGYNLFWGIAVSAVLWWIAVHFACTEHGRSCIAFNPTGTYIDIYNNKGAVLFLRELVIIAFLSILFTSSLIFPRGLGRKTPIWKPEKAYEIFYYTHLIAVAAVIFLAFTSRFDVFYPTVISWGWYVIDVALMRLFNCHNTEIAGATCYVSGSHPAINLKITKPENFRFSAGQTAFIKVPYLSTLEWHPFSIASSPHDQYLEFLIDCSHGERTWTKRLYDVCSTAGKDTNGLFELQVYGSDETESGKLEITVFGPCGSSFQSFEKFENILLIGGGSGLPSSLSVLRHLFHVRKNDKSSRVRKVCFVWSTRQFDSLLWCWGHLKTYIEQECGLLKHTKWGPRHDAALRNLTGWLDITIHVTTMKQEAFNLLVDIERSSPVGSWLVHRLSAGRVSKWTSVFSRFNEDQQGSAQVKAFFCGPSVMAAEIRKQAKTMTGFHIDVSSENFHDN